MNLKISKPTSAVASAPHDWSRGNFPEGAAIQGLSRFAISFDELTRIEPLLCGRNYEDPSRLVRLMELRNGLRDYAGFCEEYDQDGFRGMRVTTTALAGIINDGMEIGAGLCHMLTFAKRSFDSIGYAFAPIEHRIAHASPALSVIFQVKIGELKAIDRACPPEEFFFAEDDLSFDLVSKLPPQNIKHIFLFDPTAQRFTQLY